ncbi:LptF/LptG family permease [Leadbettera azotonutricia]|uniref:Putative permease, YjgP/YjgQ family n=1 Tax=Leadbettera azotonutricia (strain ATCC BAA-888 / DSM 13862 / ZAS-9) TaxID=545695 RepID=F5YBN8_LEAAZ|nr:LptF/LptG family permease [Leadbettera azotonutricia]AEF81828.1 putative permease, YjgP/YjgQ family [Leadbettera azotonutricia ZAS-9]
MILDRYLIKQFIPIFIVAISMFVLLLSLIDLFANLWRYLNYEVPAKQILAVSLYYLPKSFSYALPISLLFASAYTLGDLYGRNELTSIFSSGIPFWRFAMSLLLIGFIASFFSFFFDDHVVIPTLKMKNDLSRTLLHQQRAENNSDIVIKARNGLLIYSVDYYDSTAIILNGISIIEQDEEGHLLSLVRSPRAAWAEDHWELVSPIIYEWRNDLLRSRPLEKVDTYRELPDTFRRNMVKVEDLHATDAGLLVKDLQKAGLPFTEALSEYYHRFSFPTASFVVMILSISMGGRFKKNILLMTLLASLSSAVVFYVMEMISMMMAKLGYIPPIVGAWFPVMIFIGAGLLLLKTAKT